MSREERIRKSTVARLKRKRVKETVETIDKRKIADLKNQKKKEGKLKKKHHNE
tara:strand:+ start:2782 stop:2940 length:159 start_codon:yes stop_codon:yes gene_type:complete